MYSGGGGGGTALLGMEGVEGGEGASLPTTLVFVSHASLTSSLGRASVEGSTKYITDTILTKPVGPYNLESLTMATGYPGHVITTDEIEVLLEIFHRKVANLTLDRLTMAFPPVILPTIGIDIEHLFSIYNNKPVYYNSEFKDKTGSGIAFNISSFSTEIRQRTLNYSLQCIKKGEDEILVKQGGLHIFMPTGEKQYLSYEGIAAVAQHIATERRLFNVQPKVIQSLYDSTDKSTPYESIPYEELFPILANVCKYYGLGDNFRCVIVGCGTIMSPEGGYNQRLIKIAQDKLEAALASMNVDYVDKPKVLAFRNKSETYTQIETQINATLHSGAAAAAGGAGHAGGARKTIKRRGSRKSTRKSTKKFANRRHIVRNRRSAPRRRTQI